MYLSSNGWHYGENSARVKLDVQDPMKVKIIFPKAIAEILDVDRNYKVLKERGKTALKSFGQS